MSSSVPQTLRELEILAAQTPANSIRFRMLMATSHAQRVTCVDEAIDWISQELTKTRQHRRDRGEDALTIDIITSLRALGFDASHDKDYGGHGDIVIEAKNNFLWIGEAKVHKSYDWLQKGFEQLDTRYSTGLEGQEHGGLIIYCRGARTDQIMEKWMEHMAKVRPDVKFEDVSGENFVRRSQHTHSATGRIFKVRHVPISLYFAPKDGAKSTKAQPRQKAPRARRKVA